MTDKELKNMLKSAYEVPQTTKEKTFIRTYEKRSLNLGNILRLEFRYMGLKCFLAGIVLCLLMLYVAGMKDIRTIWLFASFLPLYACIPMLSISRSERFKMDELEAASRFSLRFIRLVRISILGLFSIGILLMSYVIVNHAYPVNAGDILLYMLIPYLVSIWGGLVVTRKWHGKESIWGVAAICVLAALFPNSFTLLQNMIKMPFYMLLLFTALLLALTVKEGIFYVRESENKSWNLC